jgi:hypothetical protein
MSNPWNPVTHPWRIGRMRKGVHLPHGWHLFTEVVATEQEARAAMDAPMEAGVASVQIDYADNASTWTKNGRWRRIATRKRGRI